jgi:hypothetical protein
VFWWVCRSTTTLLYTINNESVPSNKARSSKSDRDVSILLVTKRAKANDDSTLDLAVPVPKEGEVLVDVYASALNFFEYVHLDVPSIMVW